MELIKKILDFLTTIFVKFFPGRKEKAIDQYREIAKEILTHSKKREQNRRLREDAHHKTLHKTAGLVHMCDNDESCKWMCG